MKRVSSENLVVKHMRSPSNPVCSREHRAGVGLSSHYIQAECISHLRALGARTGGRESGCHFGPRGVKPRACVSRKKVHHPCCFHCHNSPPGLHPARWPTCCRGARIESLRQIPLSIMRLLAWNSMDGRARVHVPACYVASS